MSMRFSRLRLGVDLLGRGVGTIRALISKIGSWASVGGLLWCKCIGTIRDYYYYLSFFRPL